MQPRQHVEISERDECSCSGPLNSEHYGATSVPIQDTSTISTTRPLQATAPVPPMKINAKISEIAIVRNFQRPRSKVEFTCCGRKLGYACNYKYLGYILNECLSEKPVIEALTASATRAF